ncbi:MAG: hypothetical protein H7Z73_06390 [Candidatus Saccharibacteria bacterium]|nr:hypothetical protein [Moraxellaceae bacterium]
MHTITNRLAVIAPTVAVDLVVFVDNLKKLQSQLISADINFIFVVIFQSRNASLPLLCDGLKSSFCNVLHSTVLNVSHARNLGLEFIEKSQFEGQVLFLDSSIFFDRTVWEAYNNHQTSSRRLWFVEVRWKNYVGTSKLSKNTVALKKMDTMKVFYGAYVWSAFFSTNLLKGLRFNECFGVGEDATFQGGEDVLFIIDAFLKNESKADLAAYCYVFHPPRPLDFSKHLKYARGTGAMFGCLLSSHNPLRYRAMFLIFFVISICNSTLRCFWFKKNSIKILKLKINGYWNYVCNQPVRL